MRLKCPKCGWIGSYVEPRTAVRLSQSRAPCPSCGEPLVVHFDSNGEQRRFEDVFLKASESEKVETPTEPGNRLGRARLKKDEGVRLLGLEGETGNDVAKTGLPGPKAPLTQKECQEEKERRTGEEETVSQAELLDEEAARGEAMVQTGLPLETVMKLMDSFKGLATLNQALSERLKVVETLLLRVQKLEGTASRLEETHSALSDMVRAARLHGGRKAAVCANQDEGICHWWSWEEKPEIGLRATQDRDGKWLIQPTPPFCAACPAFQEKRSPYGLASKMNREIQGNHDPELRTSIGNGAHQVLGTL